MLPEAGSERSAGRQLSWMKEGRHYLKAATAGFARTRRGMKRFSTWDMSRISRCGPPSVRRTASARIDTLPENYPLFVCFAPRGSDQTVCGRFCTSF